jgi:1-acyl-sn-glycerol-3-phosphate acyltransferase
VTAGSALRTALGAAVAGLDTALFAPTAIAASLLLGPTHPFVNRCYREWARLVLLGCGASLRTNGDAHLPRDRHFVFVANHLSDLDAPAIIAALAQHPVRFVAKQELARIPLFGQALRATGNVIITRTDTQTDVARLDEGSGLVERVSVLFFAEGTRSRSGETGPFKRGAAAYALKTGLPLVPVGVAGTFEILPRGAEIRGAGPVGVSVGEPIEASGEADRTALTAVLRERVLAEIERARSFL